MKYYGSLVQKNGNAWTTLLTAQGSGCALCGSTTNLVLDHDHHTGEIRGILCYPCNTWLGHHLDKHGEAFLRKALKYVINPPGKVLDSPNVQEKRCARCKVVKHIDDFYQYNGRAISYCKPCNRAYQKERKESTKGS